MAYLSSFWIPRAIFPALAIVLGILHTIYPFSHRGLEPRDVGFNMPVRILSHDPLVVHLKSFISREETAYLVSLADPLFKPSGIVDKQGFKKQSENRTSSTAYLPADDPVVQRIAARAAEFQGLRSYNRADLQLTRYHRGQQYKPHVDWYDQFESIINNGNRITTFFVILEASCTQCGTRFPNLRLDCDGKDPGLNETIDCGDVEGLTVRPIPGAATFWRNLHADGLGDRRTLHAGLPPEDGVKIGLNIWTSVKTDIFGRMQPEK
ncbi:prolyl 4-hydroxylase alpha [Coleophoma crateriformis]|uniref:Prolyl 4-hydroxylase alpha n=1 Tax=Coleophoma crateriformis TaxID=565419 RepID=A0A3D8SNP8_9HELO|nr:prolyl 4-hydroxylase alpha [Coleophoma crateriformis]